LKGEWRGEKSCSGETDPEFGRGERDRCNDGTLSNEMWSQTKESQIQESVWVEKEKRKRGRRGISWSRRAGGKLKKKKSVEHVYIKEGTHQELTEQSLGGLPEGSRHKGWACEHR